MTPQNIVDKVRGLIRLSKSTDANEAAAAAAVAQRLMTKYQIEETLLEETDESEPAEEIERETVATLGKNWVTWKMQLADATARANGCRVYGQNSARFCIKAVGRPSDISATAYLFAYLSREIDRLARAAVKARRELLDDLAAASPDCLRSSESPRTYGNSFRLGAVSMVRKRLYEARKAAETEAMETLPGNGCVALAKVESAIAKVNSRGAEADAWIKDHLKLGTAKGPGDVSSAGFAAGRKAGAAIALSGGPRLGGRR